MQDEGGTWRPAVGDVVRCARELTMDRMVTAYDGNVSARCDDFLCITPSGMSKRLIQENWVSVLRMEDGRQCAGCFAPSSEWMLHAAAYRAREDVRGVIHAHSPYLTAFALCNRPVRCNAYSEMIMLFGEVPLLPYGRPGTEGIFAGLDALVRDFDVVLLANHGALALGKDLMEAQQKLETAEAVARVVYLAERLGSPQNLDEAEIQALRCGRER